jgi:hypothetical protein
LADCWPKQKAKHGQCLMTTLVLVKDKSAFGCECDEGVCCAMSGKGVDGNAPPPPQVPLMKHAARHDGLSPQFAPLENCCSCRPVVAGAGTCQRSLQ